MEESKVDVPEWLSGMTRNHVGFARADQIKIDKLQDDYEESPWTEKCKDAFESIANTQAEESRKCKDEATMVEEVVERVSDTLFSMLPLDLGDIDGMEAHMEQIEHDLDMSFKTNEVRMVGIWGMAGVGKTAIAKNIFEKHKHGFKGRYCFVANVKERGILDLQKQLLFEILRKKEIKSLNAGNAASYIKSRLANLKSLIVIDDVDDVKQLDALAKEASWFGAGSRIIITTRDKSLLNSSCAVYKIECLKDDKALQIFQRIAFKGEEPPDMGYKDLSKRISELAQGLPIALEDFGTYLAKKKKKEEWQHALKSFEEAPLEKTMTALKSSYAGLDELGRADFLHVACLFNGEPIRRVKKLLEQGEVGLRVLEEKSLIEVSADKRISMHRLLEQMGKKIVHDQNPCQQRILWNHKDIHLVLENKIGTHLIEGVLLDVSEMTDEVHINWDAYKPMYNLRFLKIYNSKQSGGLQPWSEGMILEKNLSLHKLRLLHWDAYPFTTLPTSISSDCLVELKLRYSKLKTLWSGTPKLLNLMKLDLTGSKDLTEVPDLKEAKSLEELILEGCSSLKRIPKSICELSSLQKLDVSNCDGLKELRIRILESKRIGSQDTSTCLRCIRSVRMFFSGIAAGKTPGCSLTDPSIRGNLKIRWEVLEGNAEHLSFVSESHVSHELELESPVHGFKSLDIMRFKWSSEKDDYSKCNSFSGFPWLQELNLINLNIQEIPNDIDQMQVLEKLDLSGNMFKRLPTKMSRLTKLKHLTLANCRSLEELPGLSQVESLTLSDCTNLRTLVKQDHGPYRLLELWLDNCKKIEYLPNELKHLTNLTYLDLSRHDFKTISSEMVGNLTSLVTLSLNHCNYLKELKMIPLSLKYLYAHGCKSLRPIVFLPKQYVHYLDKSPCPEWKDYSTFTRFPTGRRGKEVPVCACPPFQKTTTLSKDKPESKSLLWNFFMCISAVVFYSLLLLITDPAPAALLLGMYFLYLSS
ncbi:unnamed protein product [Eruca vesicaria subsp. sativa]|uniref:NB-ARC domain-containing protein n=1 Tax=Eruca vesicaria subsp. sativa TaxID=29727 RepID=A0ABC8LZL7_ERUVS|nr:unnamed protein product [Eruca vesicaria subsp. sativa]